MFGKLTYLIPLVLLLGMTFTGTARSAYVENPMVEDVNAGGYKIYNLSDVITKGPWVDAGYYTSFSAAIDDINEAEKTLLIPDSQVVDVNKTVPANITLWFLRGGELDISDGKTVTINGPVEAGLHKIFAGDGDVSFGSGSFREVYPQWWGAAGGGNEDDTAELQACFDSIADGQKIVIPPGTYDFNDTLSLNDDDTILDCQGRLKWTKQAEGTAILIGGRSGDINDFTPDGLEETTVHSASHGLSDGTRVCITGTGSDKYDGYWYIEDVTPNTFNIVIDYKGHEDGYWGIGNVGITASVRLDHNAPDWDVAQTGVRVINVGNSNITIQECTGFQTGLQLCGESWGVAYNKFFLNDMIDNKIGVDFSLARAGYSNENSFYGGRFSVSSSHPDSSYIGSRFVRIPHGPYHQPNNNTFYSPCFECTAETNPNYDPNKQPEYFVYCGGRNNAFFHPRNEGDASKHNVEFTSYSYNNIYLDGVAGNINDFNDCGTNNRIQTSDEIKWGQLSEKPDGSIGGVKLKEGVVEGVKFKSTGCTATGTKSVALGYETEATGDYSFAMGYQTTAGGSGLSTALGYMTEATAPCSTAIGYNTTASGYFSTAMGYYTTASEYYSTAMGHSTDANGIAGTAMGEQTTASGGASTAMGYGTMASGDCSMATGFLTSATGDFSTAMGMAATAGPATYTTAIGKSFINNVQDSFAVGFGQKDFSVESELVTVHNDLYVTYDVDANTYSEHSAFYDKETYGSTLDYSQDCSNTIKVNAAGQKEYDHEADPEFLQRWVTVKDYDNYTEQEVWDDALEKNITRRTYQTHQELRSNLSMKVAWLRQCLYELKQENQALKDDIVRLKDAVGIE